MSPTVQRSGEAMRAAAGDLARVWRATRYTSGAPVFPGLLDGVIEEFLERVAEAILWKQPPEGAWQATCGTVRVLSRHRSTAILGDEWRLAGDVLLSACDALDVAPEAVELVKRAVLAAASGVEPLLQGRGPEGIVTVRQLGGFKPRGDPRSGARP